MGSVVNHDVMYCYRLGRCGRRNPHQFFIVVVGILLLLWFVIQPPEGDTQRQDLHIFKDTFTQESLDYFAQNVQVNYSVQRNFYKKERLFKAKIVLTNQGDRIFPWKDWSIIFCQPSIAEPEHWPYPKGLALNGSFVRLFRENGGVYRMEPLTGEIEGIAPGQERSIVLISAFHNIAYTDNYPNWYFAVKGLQSRIIESTRGESYEWIKGYDTPNLWKRNSDPESAEYDQFNPLTLEERFDLHGVPDLKSAPFPVIPVPSVIEGHVPSRTVNVLAGKWVIVATALLTNEANFLGDLWGLKVVLQKPDQEYIVFVEEEVQVIAHGKILPTDESYELSVSPDIKVVTIKASRPAGAFYGIQTLLSIANTQGHIPKIRIRDAPRYEYRGVMLDVARNFQSRRSIFRYIDLMAMYKLNKLHLHLTDDEGWRIMIPGLPELTKIGATRCHDLSETKCLLPFLGSGPFSGPPGSGFFSMEDYRAILHYAALHHIEVIPEIDVPGHSHAAIKAMDARKRRLIELSYNMTEASRFLLHDLRDTSKYTSSQGFSDNAINPCLQSTYAFLSRVINSLYAMHRDVNPLKTFHFGGDEVAEGAWKRSPACKGFLRHGLDISLSDYVAIQLSNMTSLYNLDLAGWEDGLFSNLQVRPLRRETLKNKNVYAYTWNNVGSLDNAKKAYDFANNDYKVVLTPATNFYFDHPQEPDPHERGLYWAHRYVGTFDVYGFSPEHMFWNIETDGNGAPITICNELNCPKLRKKENIAGIQGTLFGELLRSQQITDFMLLPRLIALADRAWHETSWESEPDKDKRAEDLKADWTSFANTLGHKELARLDKMGFKYRIPLPGAKLEGNNLQVSTEFPGLAVEISRDGGKTWTEIDATYKTTVREGDSCMLRSRSASGSRYSRSLSLRGCGENSSAIPRGSSLVPMLFITFLFYSFV